MTTGLVTAILQVVSEGMKFLNERQRTKVMREHRELLEELESAKSRRFPFYSDLLIIRRTKKLTIFLVSFAKELKNASPSS